MENNRKQLTLYGKVAVITGASGDLGCEAAIALGQAGANLVLAARNKKKLEETSEKIGIDKSRILIVPTDVTDIKQIKLLMKSTIKKFQRIDILVTFAGVQIRKSAIEFTQEDWNYVLNVNLSGTFFCCQESAKYMIGQKSGKIIMISSLTAEIGISNMVAYVASRGAIRQLTKALAVEWAKYNINVNCIGPGRFRTRMTEDVFSDYKVRNSFLKLIPLKRWGTPSDLDGLIVFLASDSSDYITGQSIYVDGGWLSAGGSPLK